VGGIAVILDSTIVSVAPHRLAIDLDADVSTIQWVSTAYLPALGVVIPIVGRPRSRPSSRFPCHARPPAGLKTSSGPHANTEEPHRSSQ